MRVAALSLLGWTQLCLCRGLALAGARRALAHRVSMAGSEAPETGGVRTFASYSIYKGKSALSVKAVPPTFSVSSTTRTVGKTGAMVFEFAPATGVREYDWKNKGTFALDVTECGEVLCKLNEGDVADFLHDPNMGGPLAGQISKKLRLQPMQDGKGLFISLLVSDKSAPGPVSVSVPVSWPEMQVIRTLIEFSIPRFLGFDAVFHSSEQL